MTFAKLHPKLLEHRTMEGDFCHKQTLTTDIDVGNVTAHSLKPAQADSVMEISVLDSAQLEPELAATLDETGFSSAREQMSTNQETFVKCNTAVHDTLTLWHMSCRRQTGLITKIQNRW
jgi:hypothetical protein